MHDERHPTDPAISRQPIGVFDSGVGGLSVLRHLRELLPRESLLYAADTAHMPYGDKPVEQVRARVLRVAESLIALGAKALVVACNTATAAAIHELRATVSMPVIGMEPGVKPAAEKTRSGTVGVLATAGTLKSPKFAHLVSRIGANVEVIVQPCAGLVEQVERGALDSKDTESLLRGYLDPLLAEGVDALVLGCTHYPFLRPLIERLVGPAVAIIDTGPAVARQVQRQLEVHGLASDAPRPGVVRFFTSGQPEVLSGLMGRLWGEAAFVERLPEAGLMLGEAPARPLANA